MCQYQYKEIKEFPREALFRLYDSNGWALYTRDMDQLERAIANSMYVRSVWQDDQLIGLIRVVGDGESILYVQDILILPDYQRQGLGRSLFQHTMEKFSYVRQKSLLTGNTEKQIGFYRSMGFHLPEEDDCLAFIRHDI